MKVFSYIVKNKEGRTIKGVLEAESQEKLLEHFQRDDYIILSIKETKRKRGAKRGKVKIDELVVFSRQFTTLIDSKVPVVECLDILTQQTENAYFREVLTVILKEVKEGAPLSSALTKHPKVFPEIYISMVEAAEISGNLSEILERVSVYLEKSSLLRKKIISALYYPIVIVVMAVVITSFLVFKVIPTFKGIFATLGGNLPLPTMILIWVSDTLRKNVIFIIIFFILAGTFIKRIISSPKGKRKYHQFLLKLPVFGELIKKVAIAKFSRTFSTLIKSGVSIIKCLDIVAKTSGNKIIEEAVSQSKTSIQQGELISVPLEATGIFPPMVIRMIAIGERSGRLEEMLSKIAQFYEEQTDTAIAGLSSLIEPVIIVFLGVVIGGIVISLFLPIITITRYLGS